jgi:hypothetical protein
VVRTKPARSRHRGGHARSPEASGQGTSRHHSAAKHSACAWIAPGKPVDGVMLAKALGSSGFIAYQSRYGRHPEWMGSSRIKPT